jgi:hypothetical protein
MAGSITSLQAADLLGGPSAEIIYTYIPNATTWTTQIHVLDGTTKALLHTVNSPSYTSVYVGKDYDRDGKQDLLIRASYYNGAYRINNTLMRPANAWQVLWQSNPGSDPEISYSDQSNDDNSDSDGIQSPLDIDADGAREILVVREDPASPSATAWVELRNALDYTLKHSFPAEIFGTGLTGTFAAQLDADAAMEVAFFYRVGTGNNHHAIKIYDGATKALQWSYTPVDGRTFYVNVNLDFNGDGINDLILVEFLPGNISNTRVIDIAAGGTEIYQTNPSSIPNLSSTINGAPKFSGGPLMQLADVGNDGTRQFLQYDSMGTSKVARLISVPGYTEIWNSTALGYNLAGAGIFDLDPSGGDEIFLSFEDGGSWNGPSTFMILGCPGPAGTPTPTRTPAPPSATPSATPTGTFTATPMPGSPTHSPTTTPSFSVSPTPSLTATPTPTATASPSPTQTTSFTVSPTQSPTYTITPTFTPALYNAAGGPLAQLRPLNNPQRGDWLELYVELGAPADTLEVELFSPALTLLRRERFDLGALGPRSRHRVDMTGQPAGAYFVRAAAINARGEAGHKILKFYRLP